MVIHCEKCGYVYTPREGRYIGPCPKCGSHHFGIEDTEEFIEEINEKRTNELKTPTKEVDMVNHPSHYQSENGLEVIDVIETFTAGLTGAEATNTGNVLKYMCRWKKKNGLEDLKKARWYINRLIDYVTNSKGE